MSSQLGALTYLNEGSTKRKEILAKFLDLEVFENKFRKAKEDIIDIRATIRRSEERDFKKEIKDIRREYSRNDTFKMVKERECENMQRSINKILNEYGEDDAKICSLPSQVIDIHKIEGEIKKQNKEIKLYEKKNKESSEEMWESKAMFNKLAGFLETFDVASVEEKQSLIKENHEQLDQIEKEINRYEDQLTRQNKKIQLLNEVPCGSEYSHCKFIKDAYVAKDKINSTAIAVEKLSVTKKNKQHIVSNLESQKVNDYILKYEQVIEKKNTTQNEISALELLIEKNKTKMLKVNNITSALNIKRAEYNKNKEAIENLENLIEERGRLKKSLEEKKRLCDDCQKEILDLYKINGSLEQQLNKAEEELKEHKEMQDHFSAYDLFMRCMHSNGISYDIIKKRLPRINDEISKILTNIVDFEIIFVNEDSKLDILIKHHEYSARPIEMGSGAEKTIAAMAIRLALLNVSTLPKGDIFILDEPGTSLDEENMEGFIRILEMIKAQFKTVLLISHLDSLKDIVDKQIIIDKKEGFANVSF